MKYPDKFAELVKSLEGKEVTLSLSEKKWTRSLNANALYWVYLRAIVEATDGVATKDRMETLHEYFKRELLEPIVETVHLPNGKTIGFRRPKSTTVLDSKEFSDYMKGIELLTGIEIPNYER